MRETPLSIEGPLRRAETWVWQARHGDVEVRFTGRGPGGERDEVLNRIEAASGVGAVAWLKQIHSDRALAASAGDCGEGDGLYSKEHRLALAVVTADCVPVLIATGGGLAAIHAGWRGLASGVIGKTLAALAAEDGDSEGEAGRRAVAWIGPSIGPCCYEVGDEVARAVVAASGPEVARPGPSGKPHLDLVLAARLQLERAGIATIESLPLCTRCASEQLWSYRREGKGAGRNLAFIWRR